MIEFAKEQRLEVAESELFKHVKKGNLDAIKFLLDRLGGNLGYGNKTNVNVNIDTSDKVLQCIELKSKNYDKVVNNGSTDGI